ncbi:MAG: aminopeptidase [Anaerorhabdus sp.]
MNKEILKKYADLIVKNGINLQENQDVCIFTSINNFEIARFIAVDAYSSGANKVFVNYSDDELMKINVNNQKQSALNTFEDFEIEKLEYYGKKLPCFVHIVDSDPDGLNGMKMEKFNEARRAKYEINKKYRDMRSNKQQWVICAMPSVGWAKKIFPDLSDDNAFSKLEDLIIKCTKLDEDDPTIAWEIHNENLRNKAKILNDYKFDHLVYSSSNGTNFKVGLHKKHRWVCAAEHMVNNVSYTPNLPTEEVYTLPDINRADGIVYSSKPLSYQGNLIEDFSIEFKDGKAIKVDARVGKEHLEEMIKMDEGSSRLGEVALVPFDSSINKSEILFYNTLYDENASCHLALGFGIQSALIGYENMSQDDFDKALVNRSMNHVDFMIGTEDLKIIGVSDSSVEITIFENGVWAI